MHYVRIRRSINNCNSQLPLGNIQLHYITEIGSSYHDTIDEADAIIACQNLILCPLFFSRKPVEISDKKRWPDVSFCKWRWP